MDATHGTQAYSAALRDAQATLADAARAPSARVLAAMTQAYGGSFQAFSQAQSERARDHLLISGSEPASEFLDDMGLAR